jgi:hypothetical protein
LEIEARFGDCDRYSFKSVQGGFDGSVYLCYVRREAMFPRDPLGAEPRKPVPTLRKMVGLVCLESLEESVVTGPSLTNVN